MPDLPDTSRDCLGRGGGEEGKREEGEVIGLDRFGMGKLAREVSQLCPERDAPTNQGFTLVSFRLSPFALPFRTSRYSQGAPPTFFLPAERLYLARAHVRSYTRVHYAPAFEL